MRHSTWARRPASDRCRRASSGPAIGRRRLRDDELLLRIRFPVERARRTRFRKVGTRAAQAISKVVMALSYRRRRRRLARRPAGPGLGGADDRSGPPGTEAVLEGARRPSRSQMPRPPALAAEIAPIDDVRSTAGYRRSVSARVLHRLLREEGGW